MAPIYPTLPFLCIMATVFIYTKVGLVANKRLFWDNEISKELGDFSQFALVPIRLACAIASPVASIIAPLFAAVAAHLNFKESKSKVLQDIATNSQKLKESFPRKLKIIDENKKALETHINQYTNCLSGLDDYFNGLLSKAQTEEQKKCLLANKETDKKSYLELKKTAEENLNGLAALEKELQKIKPFYQL